MAKNYSKKAGEAAENLIKGGIISKETGEPYSKKDADRVVEVPAMDNFKYDPVFNCILIDKSASMSDCKQAVLEAHKAMIDALRGSAVTRNNCNLMLQRLFATDIQTLHAAATLSPKEGADKVSLLDEKNYIPDGNSTALYKSVFYALQDLLTYYEAALAEGVSPKMCIAVITDGEDNEGGVKPEEIRKLVEELKNKKMLRSSVVVGLESSGGLNKTKLEKIRAALGFDEAIECDRTNAREIRRAFVQASQSAAARLQ